MIKGIQRSLIARLLKMFHEIYSIVHNLIFYYIFCGSVG